MHQYLKNKLSNVWLVNGYQEVETPSGLQIKIEEEEYLKTEVANHLVRNKPRLSGKEFNFVRLELSSHAGCSLWKMAGTNPSDIFRQETRLYAEPIYDRFLRAVFIDAYDGRKTRKKDICAGGIWESLEQIYYNNKGTEQENSRFNFVRKENKWNYQFSS